MSGPLPATGPCPHGVVDDVCEPCTLRNELVATLADAATPVLANIPIVRYDGTNESARTLAGLCCQVVEMILEHHRTPEGTVGGLLHVQIDDGNLEDTFWEEPFNDEVQGIWERPPTQLEVCIAQMMKALPLHLRETVYEAAWDVSKSDALRARRE